MADPECGQKGWGLTNHTIKQEGMNSDEIAQVLKKKTHHVIPVIPSDQIATLLVAYITAYPTRARTRTRT